MSSDAVAKSVGKKLRYYFEVKRLEDGFDLSGVHNPQLDHPPLKPRATLQYDGLHDRPLKHYFQSPEVKVKLTQMNGTKPSCSSRERRVRKLLDHYITKSKFMTVTIPRHESGKSNSWSDFNTPVRFPPPWRIKHPYNPNYSYVQTSRGIKLRADATGHGVPVKSQKKKGIKGAYPVLRSVPPHYVSKGEANRLVNVAAKILVANETLEDLKPAPPPGSHGNKPQSAPAPFETDKLLPHIEVNQRPKTARGYHHNNRSSKYSEDGHEGHDSAYTTQRNSLGSDHFSKTDLGDGEERKIKSCWSARSSDSTSGSDTQPHPPSKGRPSRRNRPMSAKLRRSQVHVSDMSPRHREEVGVEHSVQTQGSVGIQTERKLFDNFDYKQQNSEEESEEIVRQGPPLEYQIYVRTGTRIGASTKADVKVTLYGEKGRSQEFLLAESQRHKINFQKGKEDLFSIHSPHVGKLSRVKIGHDRTELLYAWFLEGVTVYDMTDKRIYEFPCERWLSGQDGDRRTYRVLPMDRDRALIEDSDDGSSTGSDVSYIKRYNQETDSEGEKKKLVIDASKKSSEHLSVKVRQSDDEESSSSGSETECQSDSETETDSSDSDDGKKVEAVVKVDGHGEGRSAHAVEIQTQTQAASGQGTNRKVAQEGNDEDSTSPGRKQKDDFFDQKPVGPVYIFRSTTSEQSDNDMDSEKPNHSLDLKSARPDPRGFDSESEIESTDITDKGMTAVIVPRLPGLEAAETETRTSVQPAETGNSTVSTQGSSTSRTDTSTSASGTSTSRSDSTVGSQENPSKFVSKGPIPTIAVQEAVEVAGTDGDVTGGADNTNKAAPQTTVDSPRTETDGSTSRTVSDSGSSSSSGRSEAAVEETAPVNCENNQTETSHQLEDTERLATTVRVEETAPVDDKKDDDNKRDERESSPRHSDGEESSSGSDSGSETGSSSGSSSSGSDTGSDSEEEEDEVKSFAAAQVEQMMENAQAIVSSTQHSELDQEKEHTSGAKPAESVETKTEVVESEVVENSRKQAVEDEVEKADDEVENYKKVLQGPTIHEAARRGKLGRIQELLKYYPEMINHVNEAGWNALHICASEGHLDLVKWLAGEGLNLNTETPTGYSAIHLAAFSGHVNTMMVLAALGAAVCCRTTDRQTPLHLAAMSGHLESVKWLVANRARMDAKDDSDRTPLELADEYEHDDVADFLRTCEEEMSDHGSSLTDHSTSVTDHGSSLTDHGTSLTDHSTSLTDHGTSLTDHSTSLTDHSTSLTTNMSSSKNRYNDLPSIEEDVHSGHSVSEQERSVTEPSLTYNKQGVVSSSTPRGTTSEDEQTDDTPEPDSPRPQDEQIEEKRKLYSEQKIKMEESGLSFLDSIRQEYGDS